MSVQPSQPPGDGQPAGTEERRFSTLVGAMPPAPPPVPPPGPPAPAGNQEAAPRPTFTPQATGPAAVVTPERDGVPDSGDSPEPDAGAGPDATLALALPRPAPAGLDEPLITDVAALRARWQQVQAGFVDDPKEAVGDAADLIEQTAQALVGALRQRQRQLRVMWEHGPGGDGAAETEHLRLMMQHYRALFHQLCLPER
jgi:hypothetical protein